jgi:hypothetical protein
MVASSLTGEIVPCTTASIFFWMSESGCGAILTKKRDVLVSDTPYRLIASLICITVSVNPVNGSKIDEHCLLGSAPRELLNGRSLCEESLVTISPDRRQFSDEER